jgi:hydroxymethylglutaryl-CoA reductase (NADPH)
MNLRNFQNAQERREAMEKELGISLSHTGSFSFDEAQASRKNCENMIGTAQVPVGLAGPLKVKHEGRSIAEYYVPLATTEGALVASVARGCKAITESGGADVHSQKAGASRGPVFKVRNLLQNTELGVFLENNLDELARVTEQTSRHLKLKSVTSHGVGLYRFVRFTFDTQDAMGLNMVTIATDRAVRYIEEETGTRCLALSGNFCVDKKPSYMNFINNRGTMVWAEAVLPASVLTGILKTDASRMHETWLAKCMVGSAMSGSMGFNAQFANIVTAMFIATGQDPAHAVEGSLGITTAEVVNGHDLYIGVYLPDLMVGTVGGGTDLATQREALTVLGVAGGNNGENSRHFAEITGASVLAGEISLLASLREGTLAQAHRRLGRGETI